jgi:hypothetical protein
LLKVAAFRSAAAVLAPHGAALTSMLHLPPGAAVVELVHDQNVNRPWFMLMAAKLQLDYWAVKSSRHHMPPRGKGGGASRLGDKEVTCLKKNNNNLRRPWHFWVHLPGVGVRTVRWLKFEARAAAQ